MRNKGTIGGSEQRTIQIITKSLSHCRPRVLARGPQSNDRTALRSDSSLCCGKVGSRRKSILGGSGDLVSR